jgi:hypothetical protein
MDILQGTLDLLILRALELAPMHGVGIAERIDQVTRGAFVVKPDRCFRHCAVWNSKDGSRASGPHRKITAVHVITRSRAGRGQLAREKRNCYRMTSAMNWMLESEG